jgi:hypothetical protein
MALGVAIAVRGSGKAAVELPIHEICSLNDGKHISNWLHFHITLREMEKMRTIYHSSQTSSLKNRPRLSRQRQPKQSLEWRRLSFSNKGGVGDGGKRTSVFGVD